MNPYCCVPKCDSSRKKNPELSFHRFPKEGLTLLSIQKISGEKKLVDRREEWIRRILVGTNPLTSWRVCSLHFDKSAFFVKGRNQALKLNAVPTRNLPLEVPETSFNFLHPSKWDIPENIEEESLSDYQSENNDVDVPEYVEAAEALLTFNTPQISTEADLPRPIMSDKAVQVNLLKVLNVGDLISSDEKLRYFTGIHNLMIINSIVEIFENYHSDNLCKGKLNTKRRIMLVFTKFKTTSTYELLGSLFRISADSAKSHIYKMIPELSEILSSLIYFPSKREIMRNMPISFEEFQDVRVVLDFMEILVETPECSCCRYQFYSESKSKQTVKFMIGISPGGLITYVGKPYGGRASEQAIFEESNIISLLDTNNDAIMTDKNYLLDDICDRNKIKLIKPQNKSQLSAEESDLNAKIATATVHIEQLRRRVKQFSILSGPLEWGLVPMAEHISKIICAVTNLSDPILADENFL